MSTLDNQIQTAQQTRPSENPQPKEDITHQSSPTHEARATQRDQWQLCHLEEQQVSSQAPKDAEHNQLMYTGGQEKGYQARRNSREME
jgi:hypothetical protein